MVPPGRASQGSNIPSDPVVSLPESVSVGELGYREWCISLIEAGHCSCPGCGGALTDPTQSKGGWGFCQRCRCAHKVGMVNRQRYAARIPDYDTCPQAKRELAEERREQERQARRRLAAEGLGDPQR